MNRTRRNAVTDGVLAGLYARVPAVACKGLCHWTCTPIEMSNRERRKIRDVHGVDIPEVPPGTHVRNMEPVDCPALTPLKRCGVYEDRPMVCRLWGASESMPCPHGCEPVPGSVLLPVVEARVLADEAMHVGGYPPMFLGWPQPSGEQTRRNLAEHPEMLLQVQLAAERGQRCDRLKAEQAGGR